MSDVRIILNDLLIVNDEGCRLKMITRPDMIISPYGIIYTICDNLHGYFPGVDNFPTLLPYGPALSC